MDLNEKYTFFVVMFGTSNHLFFFVIVHRFSCFRTQKKNNKFSEKSGLKLLTGSFFFIIFVLSKRDYWFIYSH